MKIDVSNEMINEIMRQQRLIGMWWYGKNMVFIVAGLWTAGTILSVIWMIYSGDTRKLMPILFLVAISIIMLIKARNESINKYREGYGMLIHELAARIDPGDKSNATNSGDDIK